MHAIKHLSLALMAGALSGLPLAAHAVSVSAPGPLVASTSATTNQNDLVTPAGVTSSFNFGSSSDWYSSAASGNGYFYADYLVNVTSATAESVALTLNNAAGVTGLTERIYAYPGSFLGDAAPASGLFQAWGANTTVSGTTISYIAPAALAAGQYVVEVRGANLGNFTGTLSLTPVPEPSQAALMVAGLLALGAMAARRRHAG